MMRICRFCSPEELNKVMQQIGVDPYGVRIMLPKASSLLIRLRQINNFAANILKQEMLALGADAALARGSLTGKVKKTDILLIGQLAQFMALADKLKVQPFGLQKLALDLKENIRNFNKNNFVVPLNHGVLKLGARTRIMGIINLTPDSFSQDGLYRSFSHNYPDLALKKAQALINDGADIIDLGGCSSRPGAKSISTREEIFRTEPVVKFLAKNIKLPISIDTTNPQVAQAALCAGAQIVNDISGLRDKRMIKVVAQHKAAVVIMHMLGRPATMQKNIFYESLIDDIAKFFRKAISSALAGGVHPDKIIIDPGIGFGKTPLQNLAIIKHLADFRSLGKPLLIGPSRKSFIAEVLGSEQAERTNATIAACVLSAAQQAAIVRVHDVRQVSQALKMVEAVKNVMA